MYDLCCIGHITSDKVVTVNETRYMPGGTALYFSCAVSNLDTKYLLVTAVAEAEMHYVTDLREKLIKVKVQPSANTVYFENIYAEDKDQRTQNVWQKADAFKIDELVSVDARVFHLGPLLADDISTLLIKSLAKKGRISLDVQGYLRKVENNKVYATSWPEKAEALQYVDILKADVGELEALTDCNDVTEGAKILQGWGVKEVVVTNASKGSVIYCDGAIYKIPAYRPKEVIDTTGCGDTYMAGYLFKRTKGAGIHEAGEFAAAIAGLKTKTPGPFTGTENDVLAFLNSKE